MSRNVLAFIAAIASMVLLPVTVSAQGTAGTGVSAPGSAVRGGAAAAGSTTPVPGSVAPIRSPAAPVPGAVTPVPGVTAPVVVTPPTTLKEAGEALEKMKAAEKATAAEKAAQEKAEIKIQGAELPQPSEFQDFIAQSIGRVLPMYGYNLFAGVPSTFAPVDRIPVTPDYVIGPGDELLIRAWGQIDFDYRAVVDRAGAISIPKVGTFNVAGIRFQDLHGYLKTAIGRIFRNFELNVAMGELRSIQIFVVGQAQRPGSYTVSSLTTLVNALFASGGPSVKGSMRRIQLKRGNEVITEFDFYDLLAKGDKSKDVRLLPGDVIYIPPIGNLVAISGSVNTPAIFELKDKAILRELIDLAGGFTTTAAGQKVTVERIVDRKFRKVDEFMLDQEGLAQPLRDGDLVSVFAISPRFDNAVTLRGNVAAPARYPWRDGMRVTDLLRDNNAVIPNTYWERQNRGELNVRYNRREVNWDYAVIQRLEPSDLSTKLYAFNLGKAIQADPQENVLLRPGDIVTIYAAEDPLPQTENDVSLQGSVIASATRRFVWREGMRVRDMIPDAKWLIDYYDYWLNVKPALKPDAAGLKPDTDALKATQKKEAEINWDYANVVRLQPQDLTKSMIAFNLGAAVLQRSQEHNLLLQPGDVLTVFSKDDIQVPLGKQSKSVRLEGEFASSGIYRAEPGETLRQLVARVGGLTPNAYMFGATFTRESTRIAQQKQLIEVLDRLEREVERNAARLATSTLDTDAASSKTVVESQRALLARMRGVQPTGRIVLETSPESGIRDIPEIVLEDGDRFFVPNKPSTVSVFGAVYNESALLFKPEKRFSEYLDQTGGPTRDADTSRFFVIRADGSVVSKQGASIFSRFEGDRLNPGDTIVVPERFDRFSLTKELRDWTQIFSQFGIGIAAIKVLKGF